MMEAVRHATASTNFPNVTPQVSLELVQLQFDLRNGLRRLLVESNKMYILTMSSVYRIDLSDPSNVAKVMFPGEGSQNMRLTNVWLHPNGEFLLIQINTNTYHLLHSSYYSFKPLPRFKGLEIDFLAFGDPTNFEFTVDFVAASKGGNLYAASIKCHDPSLQANKRDDKFIKQIYDLKEKLSGIIFSRDYHSLHIFTHSGRKLTWLCPLSSFSDISKAFRKTPTEQRFFEKNTSYYFHASSFTYYCISADSDQIYSNDSELSLQLLSAANILSPNFSGDSLITTDYYLLLLASNGTTLLGASKVSHQDPIVVPLTPIIGIDPALGLAVDNNGQTRWLYTQNNIYEVAISNESISLGYAFYKLGDYDKALDLLSNDLTLDALIIKNIVYAKQAYALLQESKFGINITDEHSDERVQSLKSFHRGVKLLAKLQEPLEKVALMLLSVEDELHSVNSSPQKWLKEYLLEKLNHREHFEKNLENTILSCWLVKLYLQEIKRLRLKSSEEVRTNQDDMTIQADCVGSTASLQQSLHSFMEKKIHILDKEAIYQMTKKLGLDECFMGLADLSRDYDSIAYHHIEAESWSEVVRILAKARLQDIQNSDRIIIEATSVMLFKIPQMTSEFWLSLHDFNYELLLPTIIRYNELNKSIHYSQNPTLKFLRRLIREKKTGSAIVHTQYLLLLISHPMSQKNLEITEDIMRTLTFLRNRTDIPDQEQIFDTNLVLRSCLKFERIEPAVSILIKDLRQYETAMTLALEKKLCFLSRWVLKEFDEDWRNLETNELLKTKSDFDDFLTTIFSYTRLENEKFTIRKNLWYAYARHLIESDLDLPAIMEDQRFDMVSAPLQISTCTMDISPLKEKAFKQRSSRVSGIMTHVFGLSKEYSGSSDLLSFKNFLPLLPEVALINGFRDDIVKSLQNYNTHINHVGLELQDSALTASKLAEEVASLNSADKRGIVCTIIEPGESCCLCEKILATKNFLIFQNCHHGCHKECAARFHLHLKGNYRFKKILQTFKHTSDLNSRNLLDTFLIRACPICNDNNLHFMEDEPLAWENNKDEFADWAVAHVTSSRS